MSNIHDSTDSTVDLASTYLDWTTEQITELFSKLTVLDQTSPPSPAALLKEIHDIAHNIKGMGGSFGYHLLTDVAALLCSYTRNAEDDDQCDIKILRAHIDALDMIIGDNVSGSGGEAGNQLLTRLKEISPYS